jgi:hypothetical protein
VGKASPRPPRSGFISFALQREGARAISPTTVRSTVNDTAKRSKLQHMKLAGRCACESRVSVRSPVSASRAKSECKTSSHNAVRSQRCAGAGAFLCTCCSRWLKRDKKKEQQKPALSHHVAPKDAGASIHTRRGFPSSSFSFSSAALNSRDRSSTFDVVPPFFCSTSGIFSQRVGSLQQQRASCKEGPPNANQRSTALTRIGSSMAIGLETGPSALQAFRLALQNARNLPASKDASLLLVHARMSSKATQQRN